MRNEYAMGRRWEVCDTRHEERLNFFKKQFADILSNEPKCEDCGTILSDQAQDECGNLCFDCYNKVDENDYNPERPR